LRRRWFFARCGNKEFAMVGRFLESVTRYVPEVAVIDDTGKYTCAQVGAMTAGMAEALKALGVGKGKTVGIVLPAGVGFVAAFYGTLLAGGALVPVNFLLGAKEIGHA